jgi:hypothetical protein
VAGPGLKVAILAGGPAAKEAAEILNPLGMNLTPVATEIGRASATKLSRSIVISRAVRRRGAQVGRGGRRGRQPEGHLPRR